MNKIYIAGSGGMLGDAFYNIFKKKYDIKCTDKDKNEKWLSFLDFRNFEDYFIDVKNFKPNYLFHLGALTDLEYCENNFEDAYKSNFDSVKYAVEISNKLKIPLLFISTAGIFDGKKNIYDEDDKPNPLCIYAKTKYKAELYVQKNSKKFLICRPGWMMGGGIKKDKKFISKIINQILNGKKIINVVDDKMGTPTYTYDFAKNVELLIEKNIFGLFNLVCDGLTSRYDVCCEMLRLLNLEKKIFINKVDSSFFEKEYFAKRPESERLINKNLDKINLNIMRDWKVCLSEYINNDFSDLNL